jgi:hypothetical protein
MPTLCVMRWACKIIYCFLLIQMKLLTAMTWQFESTKDTIKKGGSPLAGAVTIRIMTIAIIIFLLNFYGAG